MPFDSDVAVLGTGVASLVAANRLASEGKTVLLLNPEWDFFREDSELPLDPLCPVDPVTLHPRRLLRNDPARALGELRPDFPGAVEFWQEGGQASGYRDHLAPHVRSRSRLWISADRGEDAIWDAIEAMYVETSDAGLKPVILEGLLALRRFPGFAARALPGPGQADGFRGVLLPKIADVDVARYRNGLLEYVREKLGPGRVLTNASQVDLMPEGVRFHAGGLPHTAKLGEGMLVFWTPRLTKWVLAQAKKAEVEPVHPRSASGSGNSGR